MAAPTAEDLLKLHKLRVTESRLAVLGLLIEHEYALAHAEIEILLPSHDRVTLYRSLQTFTDKNLAHKVLDDSGTLKYALTPQKERHEGTHGHVHFKCERCGKIECLEETPIPPARVPQGYKAHNTELLIQGVCPRCN